MKKNPLLLLPILLLMGSCASLRTTMPTAGYTVPAQKFVAPVDIPFTNTTKDAETYHWDFGDGASSEEANPTHRYTHSGNFTVVLTAQKGNKTAISKQMIQVTAPQRCLVEIQTNFGTIIVELNAATPLHRDNFLKLAEEGYFDDLLFHRVIQNFMIQGGDPNSRNAPAGQMLGMGGPAQRIPAEFVDSLIHLKGAIAAARDGNPQKASSGSQFYIVQGAPVDDNMLNQIESMKRFHYTPEQREAYKKYGGTPQLDRDYTVFGHVVEGLDVLDKIAAVKTDGNNRPTTDVKMKIRVIK